MDRNLLCFLQTISLGLWALAFIILSSHSMWLLGNQWMLDPTRPKFITVRVLQSWIRFLPSKKSCLMMVHFQWRPWPALNLELSSLIWSGCQDWSVLYILQVFPCFHPLLSLPLFSVVLIIDYGDLVFISVVLFVCLFVFLNWAFPG